MRDSGRRRDHAGWMVGASAAAGLAVATKWNGVWVFDDELRTTYVNRRLAEMLGVAAEEMTGRSAFD